jgi:hypothetical protein
MGDRGWGIVSEGQRQPAATGSMSYPMSWIAPFPCAR